MRTLIVFAFALAFPLGAALAQEPAPPDPNGPHPNSVISQPATAGTLKEAAKTGTPLTPEAAKALPPPPEAAAPQVITPEIAKSLLKFLSVVQLRGSDAPEFMEDVNRLTIVLKSAPATR